MVLLMVVLILILLEMRLLEIEEMTLEEFLQGLNPYSTGNEVVGNAEKYICNNFLQVLILILLEMRLLVCLYEKFIGDDVTVLILILLEMRLLAEKTGRKVCI